MIFKTFAETWLVALINMYADITFCLFWICLALAAGIKTFGHVSELRKSLVLPSSVSSINGSGTSNYSKFANSTCLLLEDHQEHSLQSLIRHMTDETSSAGAYSEWINHYMNRLLVSQLEEPTVLPIICILIINGNRTLSKERRL